MSETSFGFLLLGSLAAVGLALLVGTLAAILRYHRTGAFPGSEPGDVVTRRQLTGLWFRVGLGAVLTVVGVVVVLRSGLL